jgi:hypothetical protein
MDAMNFVWIIIIAGFLIYKRKWAADVLLRYSTFLPWRRNRPLDHRELRFAEYSYLIVGVVMIVLTLLAWLDVIPSSTGTRVYPR